MECRSEEKEGTQNAGLEECQGLIERESNKSKERGLNEGNMEEVSESGESKILVSKFNKITEGIVLSYEGTDKEVEGRGRGRSNEEVIVNKRKGKGKSWKRIAKGNLVRGTQNSIGVKKRSGGE